MEKGQCEHGEFDLLTGCVQCVADRKAEAEVNSPENIAKRIEEVQPKASDTMEVYVSGKTFSQEELEPNPETIGAELAEEAGISPDPNAWRTGEEEVRPANEELVELTAIVKIAPDKDEAVVKLLNEVNNSLAWAKKREVTDANGSKLATEDLATMKALKKSIEAKRNEYLAPLREHTEAVSSAFKLLLGPLKEAYDTTAGKVTAFKLEQQRKQAVQEEINRKRMEAAQQEMELKGELTESVNLVEVEEVPKLTRTEVGASGLVDNWKYEVVDQEAVPRAYLVVDDAMLKAIAKKHHDKKVVPGIRFFNKPDLRVYNK